MEFFIAVTSLLTVAAAYLLHQFWSRAFVPMRHAPPDAAEDLRVAARAA